MKKIFFAAFVVLGSASLCSSCSNEIEDVVEEMHGKGAAPGTPMNFVVQIGEKAQDASSRRKIRYDDRKDKYGFDDDWNYGLLTSKHVADFTWEVGDLIGVDCPDAEKNNPELSREGRRSQAVYEVKGVTPDEDGWANNVSDLERQGEGALYWSKEELHRVFFACPAGKIQLGEVEETADSYTRSFTTTIDHAQKGEVVEEKIKHDTGIGEEDFSSVDAYRVMDTKQMIVAGINHVYRSMYEEGDMIWLAGGPVFTSVEVMFEHNQDLDKNITIKKVRIQTQKPEGSTSSSFFISGDIKGVVSPDSEPLVNLLSIAPKEGGTTYDYVELTPQTNGSDGYSWKQDKNFSAVLIMTPWPKEAADQFQKLKFPATLSVTYQVDGESNDRTVTKNITGMYGINGRNRIKVGKLPVE